MSKVLNVGGLLYPGFEMLDLFGPLEMFSLLGGNRVRICTIATSAGPVRTAMGADTPSGPEVLAEYGVAQAPDVDVLIVPGGFGTFPALGDEALLDSRAPIFCGPSAGSNISSRSSRTSRRWT